MRDYPGKVTLKAFLFFGLITITEQQFNIRGNRLLRIGVVNSVGGVEYVSRVRRSCKGQLLTADNEQSIGYSVHYQQLEPKQLPFK